MNREIELMIEALKSFSEHPGIVEMREGLEHPHMVAVRKALKSSSESPVVVEIRKCIGAWRDFRVQSAERLARHEPAKAPYPIPAPGRPAYADQARIDRMHTLLKTKACKCVTTAARKVLMEENVPKHMLLSNEKRLRDKFLNKFPEFKKRKKLRETPHN